MSQTKEEYDKARTMSAAALRRLAVGYIWNIVPQEKQAIVLSEGVFPLPKGDQITDYLIIEDGLDDERRATRFLEKCGARCAERGRMIFWTRRRFWGESFCEVSPAAFPPSSILGTKRHTSQRSLAKVRLGVGAEEAGCCLALQQRSPSRNSEPLVESALAFFVFRLDMDCPPNCASAGLHLQRYCAGAE